MKNININNYFNEQFGYLILFVFISGIIGDLIIHVGTTLKSPFNSKWFAQSLVPYYKTNGWVMGAFYGGIACVISVVFGQLLLYVKDTKENNDKL